MWPTFAFPALIVGMTLVVAPLLIHLINMLRHRRVKWAAMDFLLQSYKRNRNWVWLKQLLLLLLRMAAVAIAVLMLAGFGCNNEISRIIAGKVTHHIVLLDDSYSLADGAGGETVFERANKAIAEIARQAGTKKGQRFTLIRFSQAAGRGEQSEASLAQATDINGRLVDKRFPLMLEEVSRSFDVSQFAVGPEAAIDVAGKLMSDDERNIVYVVSDFRVKEWENPTGIRKNLEKLHERDAEIQLISCITEEHPNVAVLEVKPVDKTRAAGVPLPVDVKVKNFGRQPAKNVQVKVRALFYDSEEQTKVSESPEQMQPDVDDLPVVLIEEIGPGETVERRVQVFFPAEGEHVVEAYVEDENQKTDDRRFTVIDFPQGVPVLLIDGTAVEYHAYYLRSAFDPAVRGEDDVRKRANTGIRPEVKNEAFLRDASPEELAKYHTIYLLDVGRLDDRAVSNLEQFVGEGGGLGIFAGENVDTNFYNGRFYKNGEGLFPLPLEGFAGLEPQLVDPTADILTTRHPLLAAFGGDQFLELLLRMVIVERYMKAKPGWKPEDGSGVGVAARLRNGDPLCVEKDYGKGRVAVFLTSVGPNGADSSGALWNNWTRTPAFPMIALELQSYLGMGRREADPRAVGEPIDLQLEIDKYLRDLKFVAPGVQPDERVPIKRTAEELSADSPLMHATLGDPKQSSSGETDRSGVYEAWTLTNKDKVDVRRFAVNVDPLEGEMAIVAPTRLEEKLQSVSPRVTEWNVILSTSDSDNNGPWAHIFLGVLIVLLLGEQLFAYLLSYHPQRGAVR